MCVCVCLCVCIYTQEHWSLVAAHNRQLTEAETRASEVRAAVIAHHGAQRLGVLVASFDIYWEVINSRNVLCFVLRLRL